MISLSSLIGFVRLVDKFLIFQSILQIVKWSRSCIRKTETFAFVRCNFGQCFPFMRVRLTEMIGAKVTVEFLILYTSDSHLWRPKNVGPFPSCLKVREC